MSRRKRTRIQPRRRRAVAEAVAAPERPAVERAAVAEAGTARAATKPGRMVVRLIAAGWSLNNNFYPAEVLKRDGPSAWVAGTHMFIDHATEDEDDQRPAGSVKDLAGILTEDARWDDESQALVAEARLFEPWRTTLMDMAQAAGEDGVDAIGLSIRAYAAAEHGEREGRTGTIITQIEQGRSVDFVTRPAAGGKILAVFESIRDGKVAEARTIGTWLESRLHLALTQYADDMYGDGRLTRDERITLSAAIGDGLRSWTERVEADAPQLFKRGLWDEAPAGEGAVEEALTDDTRARLQRALDAAYSDDEVHAGVWVEDFDPEAQTVIYANSGKHWSRPYTTENGIALAGEPVEVIRRTVYDPTSTGTTETTTARGVSTEVAEALARADQALQDSPAPEPVPARADGSPPTAAPNTPPEGGSTMSGTITEGAQPGQAGTLSGVHVSETVAVITAERDQLKTRLESVTESLTETQSSLRTAEARAEQAEARNRTLEGNEAGRLAVDKMLADESAGIPDAMRAAIGARVHDRVRGNVPMRDDGKVDEAALEALITSALKIERGYVETLLEGAGVGQPAGLGSSDPNHMSAEGFEAEVAARYAGLGLAEDTAKIAAKGR